MQIEELVEAAARRMAVADGQNPDKLSHNSFEWWRHYVPMARAAIEATLSAAEPVVYVSRKSLEQLNAEGSHVAVQTLIHRVPLRSGNGVPLFAGPLETTPSVAVKALEWIVQHPEESNASVWDVAKNALSAQVQDAAAKSLADAYQKYLDASHLYNERLAISKTKALGTMRVDEEYRAIDEARRAFDKLAVDIAKSALPAAPAKQEG